MEDVPVELPVEAKFAHHVYHLFVIRTQQRERLQEWLNKHGITTSIHYPEPIHYQPAYRDLGYAKGDFPVSEKCAEEILSIPLYPELSDDQIQYISQKIKKYYA